MTACDAAREMTSRVCEMTSRACEMTVRDVIDLVTDLVTDQNNQHDVMHLSFYATQAWLVATQVAIAYLLNREVDFIHFLYTDQYD